jgi:hypothetical protein
VNLVYAFGVSQTLAWHGSQRGTATVNFVAGSGQGSSAASATFSSLGPAAGSSIGSAAGSSLGSAAESAPRAPASVVAVVGSGELHPRTGYTLVWGIFTNDTIRIKVTTASASWVGVGVNEVCCVRLPATRCN